MVSGYVPRYCPRCGGSLEERRVEAEGRDRLVCRACGKVEYLNPKVAACTIPAVDDGRILLVRRAINPGYGRWVFPGGYVDLGETVSQAAIRETREETGVEVELQGLVNAYSYPDTAVVVLVYRARVVAGTPTAGHECLQAALYRPDEIPWDRLAFRSTRDALRDFLASQGGGVGR